MGLGFVIVSLLLKSIEKWDFEEMGLGLVSGVLDKMGFGGVIKSMGVLIVTILIVEVAA